MDMGLKILLKPIMTIINGRGNITIQFAFI